MVYMDADNDLDAAALKSLAELANLGGTQDFRMVVEVDRVAMDDERHVHHGVANLPDWGGTKRLLIGHRSLLESPYEPSSETRAQELSSFVRWGASVAPSERYIMVFWGHGSAWAGLGRNHEGEPAPMSLPELRDGLEDGMSGAGIPRFELIGFDACSMASLEVLYAMNGLTDYVVASPQSTPASSWSYGEALAPLRDDPTLSGAQIGRAMVQAFPENGDATLLSLNLNQLQNVQSALASFEARLALVDASEIDAAQNGTETPGRYQTVDAAAFFGALSATSRPEAARMVSALQSVVLDRSGDPTHGAGPTIHIPRDFRSSGREDRYHKLDMIPGWSAALDEVAMRSSSTATQLHH